MVKFSEQFEAQLVPEWKEAFVDYWKLKKCLKKIHLLHTNTNISTNHHQSFMSSLVNMSLLFGHPQRQRHHGAIQVHKKLASSASKNDMYETEVVDQFGDTDAAKDLFRCLDLELNKVNQFYKAKETEFIDRGDSLQEQMQILVELKSALDTTSEDPSISCTISCGVTEAEEVQGSTTCDLPTVKRGGDVKLSGAGGHVFKCLGKSLKINIPLTNPTRTFSAITYLLSANPSSNKLKCTPHGTKILHINKTKLHHAEKMIRGAFTELYKGLGYLKTYGTLNMLAFMKILKKFDKVTGKEVLPIYLRVVESSYFNTSNKEMNLTDQVEELFVKHFSEDDKKKAMKYLKPCHRKESHSVTYLIGLFSGCLVALFVGYVIMAHITGMYRQQSDTVYMETVYPVLSMFTLLFLHLFLYGCNIFLWRKARINYSFIFELAPTKELKYRDVFLICAASMTLVLGVMFLHLTMIAKGYSYSQLHAIPGLLSLIFLLILVCPLNILYQSSRFRFLCAARNTVLSPLYKVVMLDFFLADQMCSQVPMLRNLEYVACYYITGSYKTEDYGYCMRAAHYRELTYAVSFLPYYWRAMQCARRWLDEGEKSHLVNLGKYISAMLAAGAKVAYEREKSLGLLCVLVVVSSGATVYQLYWDFVKDWGLLQPNSNNPWLRNDLILRRKIIYYLSMGLNLVLRLAWLQSVLHSSFENVDYRVTGLFLAALEVIRRGQWNFYRLENEHLNNAGKFRAVKTVPLPFHEVDEEDS